MKENMKILLVLLICAVAVSFFNGCGMDRQPPEEQQISSVQRAPSIAGDWSSARAAIDQNSGRVRLDPASFR